MLVYLFLVYIYRFFQNISQINLLFITYLLKINQIFSLFLFHPHLMIHILLIFILKLSLMLIIPNFYNFMKNQIPHHLLLNQIFFSLSHLNSLFLIYPHILNLYSFLIHSSSSNLVHSFYYSSMSNLQYNLIYFSYNLILLT